MARERAKPRETATWIVRCLRERGYTAYFAGGCVRDELLGLEPKDYDVATDARPEQISAVFPRTALVGAAFGVILVRHDGVTTEVATFRSDGRYSDKRRPDSVHFADAQADAQRRDFTVNALFLDPLRPEGDPERIIDFVSGQRDLAARVLRAVGDADKRLAEDDLRALRAVRLSARLGFAIDQETRDAIRRHARDLSGISRERIGDELRLMLTHTSRAKAVGLLVELELDEPSFRRVRAASLGTLEKSESGEFADALAAALVDREGLELVSGSAKGRGLRLDVLRETRAALCLSNEERDGCLAVLESLAAQLGNWEMMGVAGQKRLAAAPGFSAALGICRALDKDRADRIAGRVRDLSGSAGGISPEPFINGDDLVGMGLKPSPKFKRVLEEVYDAQLEGRVQDRAESLRLARELGGEGGV
ncbi:MAG: hypothetical protein U0573_00155 [Phycisphaerales bacterium]|nr:CCA tRNA nucleotidyltransferase [Planctomycetota bacterium]